MPYRKFIAVLLVAVITGACAENFQDRPRQTAGTLLGAAAGGLLGAQFGRGSGQIVAATAGVLLGGWLGNEIGRSLDDADRLRAQQAHNQALNTGQQIRWDNPNSGNSGSVTPTRAGTDTRTGAFCREFQTTVVVGGQSQQAFGTACQQPDGSWRIMN